jgi:hypothetical protein
LPERTLITSGREVIRESDKLADQYREHLKAAGVTRAALFEHSDARMPIRLHDTRAPSSRSPWPTEKPRLGSKIAAATGRASW